jgi:hypothetical protein
MMDISSMFIILIYGTIKLIKQTSKKKQKLIVNATREISQNFYQVV